jgi:hypothetical protein
MCVSAHSDQFHADNQSPELELSFEIVCRTEESPDYLGSTYRATLQKIAVSDRPNSAFVPANAAGVVITSRNAQLELSERRSPSPILQCKATAVRFMKYPATIRWGYSIRRSSGGPFRFSVTKRKTHQ